jgi:hypothetical protein
MVKPKSFRPWNPEQTLLLLPSPVDWLPENHLVFFLLDLAGELDLEEIHPFYWQQDPHEEKACWEDAAFRVLTGNQQPETQPDQRFPPPTPACPTKQIGSLHFFVGGLCDQAGSEIRPTTGRHCRLLVGSDFR